MYHRSVFYQNSALPASEDFISFLPPSPQHLFIPAVPVTSPRNVKNLPAAITQTTQYHLLSLNDFHEDGVGRPIVPGAQLLVSDCPVIRNYLTQLKLSKNRIVKCFPPVQKYSPSNKQIHYGNYTAPASKQNSSRNSMMSVSTSTSKQSVLEKIVTRNNQNYYRGHTAVLKTASTSKHINYENYKVPNTSPTNKFISGTIISKIVPKSKQIYFANDIKDEIVVPKCEQMSSGNNVKEETIVPSFKQNYSGKHAVQKMSLTSNHIIQISEISADVINENYTVLKSKTGKAYQTRSATPRLHQQEGRHSVSQVKSLKNSQTQTITSHETTAIKNSVFEEFSPHPYDDNASLDLYKISCKRILPKSLCFEKYTVSSELPVAIPKKQKHKQRQKNDNGSQIPHPENSMTSGQLYELEHKALQEKQKELVEILTSLSTELAPDSCPPRLHKRRQKQKVVHSVACCQFRRIHQLSGWQTEKKDPINSCHFLSSGHRRWRKRRAKRAVVRFKKLQVVGKSLLPTCGDFSTNL